MAPAFVSGTSNLAKQLGEAVGLDLRCCSSFSIVVNAGEAVKVNATFYTTEESVNGVIETIRSKSYVLTEVE